MHVERTKKAINIISTAVFGVCLVLFMLTLSIGLPIYGRFFYFLQVRILGFDKAAGFSYGEVIKAYNEVLNFCTLPWVTEFSAGSLKFSADGAAHFADCKALFNLNLGVLIASAALLLTAVLLNKFKIINLLRVKGHRVYLISAAVAVALPVAVVLIVAAVGFDRAFEGFHAMFFPGKDNWVFDPAEDEIIKVMPEQFFMNCAIIIACGLIGFATALICADLILFGREKGKTAYPAPFYILIAFIVFEGAIYCAFNVITLGLGEGTDLIKYVAIIVCFIVAAVNCFFGRSKDCIFVAAAMLFTIVADLFLLALDDYYPAGIASFIVVQSINFARIYYNRKKIPVISGAIRLTVVAVLLIVLGACGSLTIVSALSAIYFPQLVINTADSALLIKKSKRYILLFIGLLLFIGCDACVGLDNFTEVGINIPAAALDIINPAIWLFYLPSQVFITLSADVPYTRAQQRAKAQPHTLCENI